MVNKIKTLKNLNKKFPRFQLETLLAIIDCIEDEVTIFPITSNPGTNEPVKPIFEHPLTPTCDNKVTCTTDNYYPSVTLTAKGDIPQEYYGYCKCTETVNDNGKEETNEVVATNDNGDVHVYVNGEECGMEFPAKSKKQPHLCDKTSCNVNILTEENTLEEKIDEYMNDDLFDSVYGEAIKKIFAQ